ncbi:uncharacterized protein [Aquarana catesbeiana]|uniref:uncharacterized protein n=1 Tax=Aquarana catesbeiana TaxID=8400 RepID=UPI003CC9A066
MGRLVLFGFMLTLASPTIRPQEPEKDQKIMNLIMDPGYMETLENNYTKYSKVKAGQEKYQPQHVEKVRIDNRRESSTNDVTDIQDKTMETMFNKTKGVAAEIISANLKSLKHFHKRSAGFSSDQYLSEPNDSTTFPYPDDSSQDTVNVTPDDTSENDDSASLNDPNNTDSSECSNAAGSSESSNPTGSKKSNILSSSEEFTYNYDSQEMTHAGSDELNRSSVLNGITIQSDSSEPNMQYSIFTTPDDVSENSNESIDTSMKADAGLSSESQSVSSSSESNDQSDSSKSSSSSDSSTSSDSSEPMTATTTNKLI